MRSVSVAQTASVLASSRRIRTLLERDFLFRLPLFNLNFTEFLSGVRSIQGLSSTIRSVVQILVTFIWDVRIQAKKWTRFPSGTTPTHDPAWFSRALSQRPA